MGCIPPTPDRRSGAEVAVKNVSDKASVASIINVATISQKAYN